MENRKTSATGPQAQPEAKETGLHGMVSAATDTTKAVATAASEYAGQARDKVDEWTAAAAGGLGKATDQVQEWASIAADRTGGALKTGSEEFTGLIRRHPGPALLVAFGLGFLAARTLRS